MNGTSPVFSLVDSGSFGFSRTLELFQSGYFDHYLLWIQIIGWGFSLFFLFWVIYAWIQLNTIKKAEAEKLMIAGMKMLEEKQVKGSNKKWERIQQHINSKNPSDWRLAILEADIILEEMLERLGYPGQTIGDKLKSVSKGDFKTIDAAWEAHKVRNAIAHEGSDFEITERETRRVIEQFESVFKEFKEI